MTKHTLLLMLATLSIAAPASADLYPPSGTEPHTAAQCTPHQELSAACSPSAELDPATGRVVSATSITSALDGNLPSGSVSARAWGWLRIPYDPPPGVRSVTVSAGFRVDGLEREVVSGAASRGSALALAVVQYVAHAQVFGLSGGTSRPLRSDDGTFVLTFTRDIPPGYPDWEFNAYIRNEISLRGTTYQTPEVPSRCLPRSPFCTPAIGSRAVEIPPTGRVRQSLDATILWIDVLEHR
jgi:hypothetical protein